MSKKRKYYSSRMNKVSLDINDLYYQLQNIYLFFKEKDYFKEKLNISYNNLPDEAKYKSVIELKKQIFPLTKWSHEDINEDNIFDTIEFLYDNISKPGELIDMTSETGWNYQDYESYDEKTGKEEFAHQVSNSLCDYKDGYELTGNGEILALGKGGLENILDAEIIKYNYENVDSKVRSAIMKWRNRHLDIEEKKKAITDLADVFEWLKKTDKLKNVLNRKDESDLFNIANNFSLRHHNPNQKNDYDKNIWYSWIFHFYLAPYHATIRLIKKYEESQKKI